MKLTITKIQQKFRRGNGITNFNASVLNGYLYTFSDENGNEYNKYSFNIWSTVCKHRISLSSEIIELRKRYIAHGMINEAEQLESIEIPYEGDVYEFNFSSHKNGDINRIKK